MFSTQGKAATKSAMPMNLYYKRTHIDLTNGKITNKIDIDNQMGNEMYKIIIFWVFSFVIFVVVAVVVLSE